MKATLERKEKRGILGTALKFSILLIMGFLIQFFVRETYDVGVIVALLPALVYCFAGFHYWRKGFFHFILFSLISISFFISLKISFDLGFYLNSVISFVSGVLFSLAYGRLFTKEDYDWLLLFGFGMVWTILAFNVFDRRDWILENALNVPFVILVLFVARWFRFSKTSYVVMFLYMFMNVIGSHYTYSLVPFGIWLSNFFHLERNHYDRIIHFCYGLLLAYPVRETFMRVGNYKGFWALFAPIMFVLGTSAIYELMEWGIVEIFMADLSVAYLGTQGDIWDAQKDMFLAGIGSVIAMFVTATVIVAFKGKFYWKEIKESFKVNKTPLGEVAITEMSAKERSL